MWDSAYFILADANIFELMLSLRFVCVLITLSLNGKPEKAFLFVNDNVIRYSSSFFTYNALILYAHQLYNICLYNAPIITIISLYAINITGKQKYRTKNVWKLKWKNKRAFKKIDCI